MLKICVCGWHLEKFDALYKVLWKLHHENDIPVHIVSNKDSRWLKVFDLPYSYRDNYGLEFGAYDYYLRNIWDGESDVLFTRDMFFRPGKKMFLTTGNMVECFIVVGEF